MDGGFPFMTRGIDTHQRKVVFMFAKVTGATVAGGTLTANGLDAGAAAHMKITETGSGVYDLTLNNPGSRFVGIFATSITDAKHVTAALKTNGSVATVKQWTTTTAAAYADGDFYVVLAVSHAGDAT